MRLLIADQFSDIGGAQRVLLELLPAFRTQGWEILLAVPGQGELTRRAGVPVADIPCGPFGCGYKTASDHLRFVHQLPVLRKRLRQLVREFGPDVLYVNGPRIVPALGPGLPPVLYHAHSYLKPASVAAVTRYLLRRARASVIGNCRFVLGPIGRGEVVYNGVPDCGFAPHRQHTGRIGIIGRIAPEKGQHVFLEAARLLPDFQFVVCGSTQFGDERAARYERELRKSTSVEFTGWRDDIAAVLQSLDLVVVASLPFAEATTRVIPEAYSAGVPVVASDLPGIREIVSDGETGFLFQPGNAAALARRIHDALNGPAVVASARRAYEERFSLDGFQRRMISSLSRLGASERA